MGIKNVNLNIPVSHSHNVLSWDKADIGRLVSAAIDVAVRVGMRLGDDAEGIFLSEAESKGARIDWNARAVMFREADIEETIAIMRQTKPAPEPVRPLSISDKGRDERFAVGNGANMLFDYDAWQVRPPTASDMVELCRWAQGCEEAESLEHPVMLKDMDQRLEPLYGYALMCRHCRKKVYQNQPTEPIHVRYLAKMARVVEKHRGFYHPVQEWEYVNPPFRMGFRSVATMLERVDSGACSVMGVGAMPVSGMSAPVTVAGHAVTALAETLAGLTLFRILRPGYGLKANVCGGCLDLRTARVSYFGMHTHLCNLATWELLVRGIGVDSPCLTLYRDANEPGMQALYEFGMAQAFFSSVYQRSTPEIGGLACGNIFSPHQAVLDMEAIKEFNELIYGFELSEEALGIEEVVKARFEQGVHMSTEHTLERMNDGIPFSKFLYRGLVAGAQHDKHHTQTDELMQKAAKEVEAARARGWEVEPDDDLGGELYEFVKEAASDLGIESPPLI